MDAPVGRRGSALASCVDGLGVREPILEETRRLDGRPWLAALRSRLARAAWIWRCQRGCKRKDREQPAALCPSIDLFVQLAVALREPPPRTASARMMKPMPLSISAIPTTMLNSPICSAM
jgi:hypothetical protein